MLGPFDSQYLRVFLFSHFRLFAIEAIWYIALMLYDFF